MINKWCIKLEHEIRPSGFVTSAEENSKAVWPCCVCCVDNLWLAERASGNKTEKI